MQPECSPTAGHFNASLSPRLQSNHSYLKLLQACHDKRLHQASNHQFHATHEKIPIKISQKSKHSVLYPSSQSLPQTSTTALTGSATKSNQCCHLERISIQIGLRLVRAEPALQRFSASECGPREATPKHQTSRMATSWRQSSQPNLRHPQLARPDPHNASACVSASLPSNSRCGFSICLSFTFCFLYSLLYFSLVLAKNRLALSIQRHSL